MLASMHELHYFYRDTCGPCRSVTPQVQQLVGTPGLRVFVHDAGTQAGYDAARSVGVSGTPTLILGTEQTELARLSGAPPGGVAAWVRSKLG